MEQFVPTLNFDITHVLLGSDGAAGHFKQKSTLFYLADLSTQYPLVAFSWSFTAPGHGKGVWDGLGGIVKSKKYLFYFIFEFFFLLIS